MVMVSSSADSAEETSWFLKITKMPPIALGLFSLLREIILSLCYFFIVISLP